MRGQKETAGTVDDSSKNNSDWGCQHHDDKLLIVVVDTIIINFVTTVVITVSSETERDFRDSDLFHVTTISYLSKVWLMMRTVLMPMTTEHNGGDGQALAWSMARDAGRTVIGPSLQQGHVHRSCQACRNPSQGPWLQVPPQQSHGQLLFVGGHFLRFPWIVCLVCFFQDCWNSEVHLERGENLYAWFFSCTNTNTCMRYGDLQAVVWIMTFFSLVKPVESYQLMCCNGVIVDFMLFHTITFSCLRMQSILHLHQMTAVWLQGSLQIVWCSPSLHSLHFLRLLAWGVEFCGCKLNFSWFSDYGKNMLSCCSALSDWNTYSAEMFPWWDYGTLDTEIKVPSVENLDLSEVPSFKLEILSEYRFACFAYCQGFCLSDFYLLSSFNFNFSFPLLLSPGITITDLWLGEEQDQLPCGSSGTSSVNCQETEICMVQACHTPQRLSKTILQGTFEGGGCSGQQKKCWMDNIREGTSLPMPEPFTKASCRKVWKRISAESSPKSPQRPSWLRDWTELNWLPLRLIRQKEVFQFSSASVLQGQEKLCWQ